MCYCVVCYLAVWNARVFGGVGKTNSSKGITLFLSKTTFNAVKFKWNARCWNKQYIPFIEKYFNWWEFVWLYVELINKELLIHTSPALHFHELKFEEKNNEKMSKLTTELVFYCKLKLSWLLFKQTKTKKTKKNGGKGCAT